MEGRYACPRDTGAPAVARRQCHKLGRRRRPRLRIRRPANTCQRPPGGDEARTWQRLCGQALTLACTGDNAYTGHSCFSSGSEFTAPVMLTGARRGPGHSSHAGARSGARGAPDQRRRTGEADTGKDKKHEPRPCGKQADLANSGSREGAARRPAWLRDTGKVGRPATRRRATKRNSTISRRLGRAQVAAPLAAAGHAVKACNVFVQDFPLGAVADRVLREMDSDLRSSAFAI